MDESKKNVACKTKIITLINGELVKKSGWEPSYVQSEKGNIYRASIIATIVSLGEGVAVIDDGSASIPLRAYSEAASKLATLSVGDLVLVIGRPRHWEDETYLVPEIIKKVDDARWKSVWEKECGTCQAPASAKTSPEPGPATNEPIPEKKDKKNPYEEILAGIADLDKGEGADIDAVLALTGVSEGEKIIRNLLEEGEIFQISPGKIKVLE